MRPRPRAPDLHDGLIIYHDENGEEQRSTATARLEYYKYPAALPTVELFHQNGSVPPRLTINAMALRLNKGQFGCLVDFGGQSDIQRDDPHHPRPEPWRIPPASSGPCAGAAVRLPHQHAGRKAHQERPVPEPRGKTVRRAHPARAEPGPRGRTGNCLRRLNELGVLAAIHPSLVLNADKNELLDSLREVIDWYRLLYFKETPELSTLYIMALCSAVPAIETADILHRLGLTPTMREEILSLWESVRMTLVELINWHRDTQKKGQAEQSVSRLCALLAPLPLESTLYLMARSDNEEISSSVSQYIYKWRQIKVDINGDDLHRLGLEPGPQFGSVMRMVLAAKLDGKAETREAQLKLAEELFRKGFPGNGTAGAAPKKPR
ncbi:MAG: hypothetical protein ACLUDQ_12025 [Bilophila wadsworthia]